MKKIFLFLITICALIQLSACNSNDIRMPKSATTGKKIVAVTDNSLNGRPLSYTPTAGTTETKNSSKYNFFALKMNLDSEQKGLAKVYYYNGNPDNPEYDKIYIFEIDITNYEIVKQGSPNIDIDGVVPLTLLKDGVPLDIEHWKIDSTEASSIASRYFYNTPDFRYDYIEISALTEKTTPIWKIIFSSLTNSTRYECKIDPYTGRILSGNTFQ